MFQHLAGLLLIICLHQTILILLPATPIGRLSAVTQNEVAIYLSKVKEYEAAQQNNTQTVANKAWMKTMVHVTGADDPGLNAITYS